MMLDDENLNEKSMHVRQAENQSMKEGVVAHPLKELIGAP